MNKIMILLACIWIVSVFVEFQSLVDGPGLPFVGGIICPQALETCCDSIAHFRVFNVHTSQTLGRKMT